VTACRTEHLIPPLHSPCAAPYRYLPLFGHRVQHETPMCRKTALHLLKCLVSACAGGIVCPTSSLLFRWSVAESAGLQVRLAPRTDPWAVSCPDGVCVRVPRPLVTRAPRASDYLAGVRACQRDVGGQAATPHQVRRMGIASPPFPCPLPFPPSFPPSLPPPLSHHTHNQRDRTWGHGIYARATTSGCADVTPAPNRPVVPSLKSLLDGAIHFSWPAVLLE